MNRGGGGLETTTFDGTETGDSPAEADALMKFGGEGKLVRRQLLAVPHASRLMQQQSWVQGGNAPQCSLEVGALSP